MPVVPRSRRGLVLSLDQMNTPLPLGWVIQGQIALPGRMGRHHPASTSPPLQPTGGKTRRLCPFPTPRALSAGIGGGFSSAENNAFLVPAPGLPPPKASSPTVFLRSERAPWLVAPRGRRRGGAALGGCPPSAGSRAGACRRVCIVPARPGEREWDTVIFSC